MQQLSNSPVGSIVPTIEGHRAFIPDPLPRDLSLSSVLVDSLTSTSHAVGVLAGVGETIANPLLLYQPLMRREAELSSRIEGTVSSLSEVIGFEVGGRARFQYDAMEVVNYVRALQYGIDNLQRLPISYRLVNEMHAILMEGVRGQDKLPGAFRDNQVYIGSAHSRIEDARYVPPPPDFVRDLFHDLENFVNEREGLLPPLIRCALMHYQFEAIHPYRDGNGRIGRLLIPFFLQEHGLMPIPLLYLSAYFERDRQRYYDELFNVSVTGNRERWLLYFLEGVETEARDAAARIRRLRDLQEEWRALLRDRRESASCLRLLDEVCAQPVLTVRRAAEFLGVTRVGARRVLDRLVDAGIVQRLTGTRPNLYFADRLIEELERPHAIDGS